MSAYVSVDIEVCRKRNHHFELAWSDVTPMKVSIICKTCTAQYKQKTAYAAYGVELGSFGVWRDRKREIDPVVEDLEA